MNILLTIIIAIVILLYLSVTKEHKITEGLSTPCSSNRDCVNGSCVRGQCQVSSNVGQATRGRTYDVNVNSNPNPTELRPQNRIINPFVVPANDDSSIIDPLFTPTDSSIIDPLF